MNEGPMTLLELQEIESCIEEEQLHGCSAVCVVDCGWRSYAIDMYYEIVRLRARLEKAAKMWDELVKEAEYNRTGPPVVRFYRSQAEKVRGLLYE